jgi:hypothetical protein
MIHLLFTVKTGTRHYCGVDAPTAVYDQLTEPQRGIEWVSSQGVTIL